MNRARRCLTSVIEQISMSERRIPYIFRLMSINRVLLSNSVNNDITLCLFKRIMVVEI